MLYVAIARVLGGILMVFVRYLRLPMKYKRGVGVKKVGKTKSLLLLIQAAWLEAYCSPNVIQVVHDQSSCR